MQRQQVAAIAEEMVKDVNARIANDKGTASENNIVNNDDEWSNNLMTTMYQCKQEVHALVVVFSASRERHRICS